MNAPTRSDTQSDTQDHTADANTTHLSIRHDRTAEMDQQTRRSRSAHGSLAHFSRQCRGQNASVHHCRARQPLNRRTTRHQLLSPHVCEHTHDTPDQARVSIMTACSDAWLKARTVGGGARGVQREQRAHRHARCPLLPQPRPSCGKQSARQLSHSSSAIGWIRTGPSTGTGTDLPAVPVAIAAHVPCNAEAWREPSRDVSPVSRKSLHLPWAMFFCRCNASCARACLIGCVVGVHADVW